MAFRRKAVFTTGAGSGMGWLAARRLAVAGAQVATLNRNEAASSRRRAGRSVSTRGRPTSPTAPISDGGDVSTPTPWHG